MECAPCEVLKHVVETYKREYKNAVLWLGELMESPDAARYRQARHILNNARLEYVLASTVLEQHLQNSHGAIN